MVPASLKGEVNEERGCTMFADLGVYGLSTKPGFSGRADTLRQFEKFTLEKGGFQALYAETLMSYEEFCQMFKEHEQFYSKVGCQFWSFFFHQTLVQARVQLPFCLEAFPDVYHKVSKAGRQAMIEKRS